MHIKHNLTRLDCNVRILTCFCQLKLSEIIYFLTIKTLTISIFMKELELFILLVRDLQQTRIKLG